MSALALTRGTFPRDIPKIFRTTCLQASTSPLASFTPPLSLSYLSHSVQPLDLIDRCQPPVLCATDCDIVSCNRPTLRRTCPRDRTWSRTTITQVTPTVAAPTALHTCTHVQCIASHTAPTIASTPAPSATPPRTPVSILTFAPITADCTNRTVPSVIRYHCINKYDFRFRVPRINQ